MSSTYDVRIRRDPYSMLLLAGGPQLSKATLEEALAGAFVQTIVQHESGDHVVTMQLKGKTHVEAFNEIAVAIQQLGYGVVQATITDWADNFVEGAVAGFLGGGAAGSTTNDLAVTVMTAIIGTVVGAVVGSFFRQTAVYDVRRARSGWQLVRVSPIPAQLGRPSVAPAT